MEDKPCIKGNQLIAAKEYLAEKYGAGAFDKVVERIDPEYRRIVSAKILPSSLIEC